MLVDRKPRIYKPRAHTVVLDRAHPLANGLVFATLMEGPFGFEYVNGFHGIPSSGSTLPSAAATNEPGHGVGLSEGNGVAGQCLKFSQTVSDAPYNGAITVSIRGSIVSNSSYRMLMTKVSGNGATNSTFEFRCNPSNVLEMLDPTLTHGANTVSAGLHTLGFAGLRNNTNNGNFYIDGISDTGNIPNYSGPSGTSNTKPILIGERDDATGFSANGTWLCAYIWKRELSTAEMLWIHQEPYAFFRPITIPHVMTTSVAGPAFQAAWAVRKNQAFQGWTS